MRRIYPREEHCMACRRCEVACILAHSATKDPVKAYKNAKARLLSRNVFESKAHESFALTCRHCANARCMEACMTGAMHRDERGAVVVDEEKCVGCWMCIMACPWGAIQREQRSGKVSWKCDLCPNLDTPACVDACPNRALVLVEDED